MANGIGIAIIVVVIVVALVGIIMWHIGINEAIAINESDDDVRNRRKEVKNDRNQKNNFFGSCRCGCFINEFMLFKFVEA